MNNAMTAFALGQLNSEKRNQHPIFDNGYYIETKVGFVTFGDLVKFYEENYKDKEKDKQQSANEKAAKSKSGVEVLEAAVDEGTEDGPSDKKATEQKCELSPSKSVKRRRKLQKS